LGCTKPYLSTIFITGYLEKAVHTGFSGSISLQCRLGLIFGEGHFRWEGQGVEILRSEAVIIEEFFERRRNL